MNTDVTTPTTHLLGRNALFCKVAGKLHELNFSMSLSAVTCPDCLVQVANTTQAQVADLTRKVNQARDYIEDTHRALDLAQAALMEVLGRASALGVTIPVPAEPEADSNDNAPQDENPA